MDNNVTQIPFGCIIEKIPTIEHYKNDILLLKDTNGANLFMYPFKPEGVFVGIMKKGIAVVRINLKQFELKSGQIFICSPGDIVQFISAEAEEIYGLGLSLDFILGLNLVMKVRDFVADVVMRNDAPIMDLPPAYMTDIESLYQLILKNVRHEGAYQKDLLKSLCTTYIYLIGRMFNENKKCQSERKENISQRSMAVFMRFMELLDEHHQNEREMAFYAKKVHLTPKHFSTLIKKVSGTNATEWINRYVILEAKSMLMYSDKSIQEIAFALNFPNPSFFGRYFKHHTGMSPGEYRSL